MLAHTHIGRLRKDHIAHAEGLKYEERNYAAYNTIVHISLSLLGC